MQKMFSLRFMLDLIHMTIPVIGLCNALNIEDLKLDHGLNLLELNMPCFMLQ